MNESNVKKKLPYEVKSFFELNFENHPRTGLILFIVLSLVLLFGSTVIFPMIEETWIRDADKLTITMIIFVTVLVWVLVAAFIFLNESKKYQKAIDNLKKEIKENKDSINEYFKRFEHMFNHKERAVVPNYVYVDFEPTIKSRGSSDSSAAGPAIEVLAEIFGRNQEYKLLNGSVCSEWLDLAKRLNNFDAKKSNFDSIVATPMYEIRERKQYFDFCSPLFYADVSAYTQKDSKAFRKYLDSKLINDATHCCSDGTFEDLAKFLGENTFLLKGVKGELNYFLLEKYSKAGIDSKGKDDAVFIPYDPNFIYHPEKCVNGLVYDEGKDDKERTYSSDIFFGERFIVERTAAFKSGKIISLLKPKQLLFPLCFAVKKGEDTLRKFINLGILNLQARESKKYDGMSKLEELLVDGVKDLPMFKDFSIDDAIKYFRNDAEVFQITAETINNVINLRQ